MVASLPNLSGLLLMRTTPFADGEILGCAAWLEPGSSGIAASLVTAHANDAQRGGHSGRVLQVAPLRPQPLFCSFARNWHVKSWRIVQRWGGQQL